MSANKYLSAIHKETSKKPVDPQVASEWAEVLNELNIEQCDKVPRGWMTMEQIAESMGKSPHTVRQQVAAMRRKRPNAIEVRRFRIQAGDRIYPVPHYKLKL